MVEVTQKAKVNVTKKACAVNPLKMSQPIGGAYAFLGLRGAMPLLHGSQGCTSFGLTLFVRHYKENVPMQTTAMSEVATVLGDLDNVEQAILNIYNSTPNFKDAFQDGWEKTIAKMVEVLVDKPKSSARRDPTRVNVLPGCHLTPGDIEELRTICEDFGLEPSFLPDLGTSLDGHIPEDFCPTTIGGIGLDEIATMGQSGWTIAVGAQMRRAAEAMQEKTGVPFRLFERLCGLEPNDDLMMFLSEISGRPVPEKYRRRRGQLADAMLDSHFWLGGRKLAIGAEPDLLYDLASFLHGIGTQVAAAVTTTQSPVLERLPTEEVLIGDLEDLETFAKERDCDLLITHAHGRQMAARLNIPFYRAGFPIFDRLGPGHQLLVGYRGSREVVFDIANLLIEDHENE